MRRGGAGGIVLHASLVGKACLSAVCRHLYGFCPAGDAIWVDRQLPDGNRRAILKVTHAVKGASWRRDVKRDVKRKDEGRETAPPYRSWAARTGPARLPPARPLARLSALSDAQCQRKSSRSSGYAQWP